MTKLPSLSQRKLHIIFIFSLLLCVIPSRLWALPKETDSTALNSNEVDEVYLLRGELTALTVNGLTRISVVDPEIADIANAEDHEITLIGKDAGQTTLFIWDEDGKRSINIHVSGKDLRGIQTRIKKLLDTALINEVQLESDPKEGKVVISGEIPAGKQAVFDDIVLGFSDDIINLVKGEEINDLIQVDLQISELSVTLDRVLGIDWNTEALNYVETPPSFDGTIPDFFKIGDFSRTTTLAATVNNLITEGKGKVLSKPKLVVESGNEASFLVGGEIPIRTTTTNSAGGDQENVSYKQYGVGMTISPTIKAKNKIEILLTTEISEIDRATQVTADVAFLTRSAQTQVLLNDGQNVILAGLIKSSQGDTVSRVPFFSNIPIMGLLFRKTTRPKDDTEVVISMTPRIVGRNRSRYVDRQEEEQNKEDLVRKNKIYQQKGQTVSEKGPLPFYAGIPPEMADYVRKVQQKISESIVFPKEARENGWQGTVKLGVMILHDGTLAYAMVKESSGFDLFDEYAVSTAKNVAPYESFPPNTSLQELNVTIPIVYSIGKRRLP